MAYRHRAFEPGAAYHMTARGIDGLSIFPTAVDCFSFLGLLRRVTGRVGWTIVSWCLMGTHYHLIVFAPAEPRISWAMQTLNSVYAREFNHRLARRGHVFGERFTDTLVASERHLDAAIDYLLENPVRAGLVSEALDWPWSGDHLLVPRPVQRIVTPLAQDRDTLVRRRG